VYIIPSNTLLVLFSFGTYAALPPTQTWRLLLVQPFYSCGLAACAALLLVQDCHHNPALSYDAKHSLLAIARPRLRCSLAVAQAT
jgi:hypothetical protein